MKIDVKFGRKVVQKGSTIWALNEDGKKLTLPAKDLAQFDASLLGQSMHLVPPMSICPLGKNRTGIKMQYNNDTVIWGTYDSSLQLEDDFPVSDVQIELYKAAFPFWMVKDLLDALGFLEQENVTLDAMAETTCEEHQCKDKDGSDDEEED